jgi:hypothetical protein
MRALGNGNSWNINRVSLWIGYTCRFSLTVPFDGGDLSFSYSLSFMNFKMFSLGWEAIIWWLKRAIFRTMKKVLILFALSSLTGSVSFRVRENSKFGYLGKKRDRIIQKPHTLLSEIKPILSNSTISLADKLTFLVIHRLQVSDCWILKEPLLKTRISFDKSR